LAAVPESRRTTVVDAEAMAVADADELARLIAAAERAEPQPEVAPGRARDSMSYTITIDDDGRSIELKASDTTISREFAELKEWLEEHAGPQP
jgi:Emfourin